MYGSRNVNSELFEDVPSKAKVVPLTLAVITRSFPSSVEVYETISGSKSEPSTHPFELGDIAIAYEVCKTEAIVSKIKLEDHVHHLIVHSVLHLLGFDHEEEKNAIEMEKIEVQVLAKLGINNPYG